MRVMRPSCCRRFKQTRAEKGGDVAADIVKYHVIETKERKRTLAGLEDVAAAAAAAAAA